MGSISQFGGLDGCWACRWRWRRREGLADDEGEFAGRAGRLNLVDELLASRPHQKVRLNARLLRLQDDDVVPKLHLHALSADYCSRDNIWELDHRCVVRSEEHTSELQSPCNLVCPLLLEKKKKEEHTISNSIRRTRRFITFCSLRSLFLCLLEYRSVCFIASVFELFIVFILFFFNDTATTEIYTLSLHDALPISSRRCTISMTSPARIVHRRRSWT